MHTVQIYLLLLYSHRGIYTVGAIDLFSSLSANPTSHINECHYYFYFDNSRGCGLGTRLGLHNSHDCYLTKII